MSRKQITWTIFLLFFVETALMILWFYLARPAMASWEAAFWVIPILFGINALLGLVFYFVKKPVGYIFFGNAVFAPLLFFAIWIMWFTYWAG